MQRLFEQSRKRLEAFIEQRDDLLLLASCTDNDAPLVLKLLRDAEQANGTDVILLFADDFVQPGPYVSVLAERLRTEHQIACEVLQEDGREPLPAIPEVVFDSSQPPALRLYKAISFARSLLPERGGNRLVWVMCPSRIADRRAYLELISPFAPRHGIQPWMRGLRLVARDELGTKQFVPGLAGAPRVRTEIFDFGPAALERALQEEAEDESVPQEQRMQWFLMLASLDSAHQRTPAAVEKYQVLLGHYQHAKNLPMQALVMIALGDIAHRVDQLDQAQYWYECALLPAGEAKDPVLLSTVIRNLGNIAFARNRYGEAEQYFEGLDKLAARMLSPQAKMDALQWQGLAQERQGKWQAALQSWEGAATLGRSLGDEPGMQKIILGHLRRAYTKLGIYDKRAAVEAEWQQLAATGII